MAVPTINNRIIRSRGRATAYTVWKWVSEEARNGINLELTKEYLTRVLEEEKALLRHIRSHHPPMLFSRSWRTSGCPRTQTP